MGAGDPLCGSGPVGRVHTWSCPAGKGIEQGRTVTGGVRYLLVDESGRCGIPAPCALPGPLMLGPCPHGNTHWVTCTAHPPHINLTALLTCWLMRVAVWKPSALCASSPALLLPSAQTMEL